MRFTNGKEKQREKYLDRTARNLAMAAVSGKLDGKPYSPDELTDIRYIAGLRVGMLKIRAGMEAPRLLKSLTRGDYGATRDLIAWDFAGSPFAYMNGRFLWLGAPWSNDLATMDVRLSDVGYNPKSPFAFSQQKGSMQRYEPVWFPGVSETGDVVAMSFGDACPHVLIAGPTGTGKSVAMQNAVLQFSNLYPHVKMVLIDAKDGQGLGPVFHARGLVAPLATQRQEIQAALLWAVSQVTQRNRARPRDWRQIADYNRTLEPVIIFLDEIQELTIEDNEIAELIRQIAHKGRAALIHLLIGTQKPLIEVFGSRTTKANLPGRVALQATDYKESEVIVGRSFPRADYLMRWEAYCLSPDPAFEEGFRRVQLFNVTKDELSRATPGKPEMDQWPAMSISDALGEISQVEVDIDPRRGALALIAAHHGKGRDPLQEILEAEGVPLRGNVAAGGLIKWGKETLAELEGYGYSTCRRGELCEG